MRLGEGEENVGYEWGPGGPKGRGKGTKMCEDRVLSLLEDVYVC